MRSARRGRAACGRNSYARVQATPRGKRWSKARGPITFIILTMDMCGWRAETAETWIDPNDAAWELSNRADTTDLLLEVHEELESRGDFGPKRAATTTELAQRTGRTTAWTSSP